MNSFEGEEDRMFKRRLAAVLAALMLASITTSAFATAAGAAPLTCADKGNPAEINKGGQCK
jgi:hypothetical protein